MQDKEIAKHKREEIAERHELLDSFLAWTKTASAWSLAGLGTIAVVFGAVQDVLAPLLAWLDAIMGPARRNPRRSYARDHHP